MFTFHFFSHPLIQHLHIAFGIGIALLSRNPEVVESCCMVASMPECHSERIPRTGVTLHTAEKR